MEQPMANILFICGSLNQTTQLHKISKYLEKEHSCYFTPYFADGLINFLANKGMLDFTVLGGRHRVETDRYLLAQRLKVDWRGESRNYDLVVTSSDLLIQNRIRGKRLILVQEGITEPETSLYWMVKWLKLPRFIGNTSTSGLSDAYDIFCVASEGYAEHFIRKGVLREKITVTGIPNFDDLHKNLNNDFPYRNYVLVATSPLRETFRRDDREAFIKRCVQIANGRQLIFKLHPTEKAERAVREIEGFAPGAMILIDGNVNHMIANASTVITQQSTCTFVAVALGKEIYTNLNIDELRHLMPIQNGGVSSKRIANICKRIIHTPIEEILRVRAGYRVKSKWKQAGVY